MTTRFFYGTKIVNYKIMNYTVRVEEVDSASLLMALGYECQEYTIMTNIDLNGATPVKREKTASYQFADISDGCKDYGTAKQVLEGYKLPSKGQSIKTVLERAKLAAHNYQVLKSVILHAEPLQQIEGKGYTMLKNANGVNIPDRIDSGEKLEQSSDIASIAIACAMGCKVKSYLLESGRLSVAIIPNDKLTISRIEQEKNNTDDEDNYSDLSVLVAAFSNREELIKGIYARQQVMLTRGSKKAIFSANAKQELKNRILKELNT